MKSFEAHWSDVYHMLGDYDAAFDYSQVMRIGEDAVLVDGEMFYRPEF